MQSPTRIYQKSVSFHFLHFLRGIIWILFHFILFQSATINKYMHVLVKLNIFWSYLNMICFKYLDSSDQIRIRITFWNWYFTIKVFIILFLKTSSYKWFLKMCKMCFTFKRKKNYVAKNRQRKGVARGLNFIRMKMY